MNCQFTFGVFTKWDECLKKAKEEGEETVRNVCQTAKDYKEEFRNALEGKGKVYFVNVKNVGHADVSRCILNIDLHSKFHQSKIGFYPYTYTNEDDLRIILS